MHIELSGLTKYYGRQPALEDLSLTIEPGQIVAIVGTNGAGKSTLLRLLATVLAPTRGSILLDGQPLDRGRLDLRRWRSLPTSRPCRAGQHQSSIWI
jgi:ABC-type multidrug transport system ATPase subunit